MDCLRLAPREGKNLLTRCTRCKHGDGLWDRLAGKALCPNCQEALAMGEGEPFVERAAKKPCAVCSRMGTLCYRTFPLHVDKAVEMDLCAEHFRDLLGRRLGPYAYQQLRRQLQTLGLSADQVFLLHDAFYDRNGRALQPAQEQE